MFIKSIILDNKMSSIVSVMIALGLLRVDCICALNTHNGHFKLQTKFMSGF